MRISDWSSDVCSSDLPAMDFNELIKQTRGRRSLLQALGVAAVGISFGGLAACSKEGGKTLANGEEAKLNFYNWDTYIGENKIGRASCRERCVRTCRSRWSRNHEKKKEKKKA